MGMPLSENQTSNLPHPLYGTFLALLVSPLSLHYRPFPSFLPFFCVFQHRALLKPAFGTPIVPIHDSKNMLLPPHHML
ncbi:hypothetical protein AX774_g6607 [Zancudomyces culisetae]|uniref:Uncharacterized protein n=1 Tax=Zancudomyces culisetae TaxID=1213189 RepID=A0A1R1PG95_ZANCU|nr:hypothetical protein AX774_g6607 [Zancudomyces culisetae]|eukprot:OMH79967.1 hypothetical protein AX774_g6607 [Zancudomyces culisetae]